MNFAEKFGTVKINLRLRTDNEEEGRNLLQNFREKTESELELVGSVNEKVQE